MHRFFIGLFLGFIFGIIVGAVIEHTSIQSNTVEVTPQEQCDSLPIKLQQPEFFLEDKPTPVLVLEACKYYEIQYPEIVTAQSILETGHYKSKVYLQYNNLFGLYNSKKRDYYSFNHWTESVKAYYDLVQYRYKEGDYYAWLSKIGYAEDPNYIAKVKSVQKRYIK